MDSAMALVENKKARMRYEMLEEFEAGIELLGFEVKALRAARAKLDGAHVVIRGGEAFIVGMSATPLQPKNTPADYEPLRTRRLLLTRKELTVLASAEHTKGLTIVPISVYVKGRKLKVRLAIARGRKQFDKRQVLKKRDTKREIERTLKNK